MFDKLQDIIGVLLILGLLLLIRRILFPEKPPPRPRRTRTVPREIQKSRTD
jgi:hypothetical protein